MAQNVYVVDLWDRFSPDIVISKHRINNRWWAVKEVSLKWGIPQLNKIDEDDPMSFQIYETAEEAESYLRKLKKLEGVKF